MASRCLSIDILELNHEANITNLRDRGKAPNMGQAPNTGQLISQEWETIER